MEHDPKTADASKAFRQLLLTLSEVYAGEGRPGGDMVAEAYLRAAKTPPDLPPQRPYRLDAEIRAATEGATHPAAIAARSAHSVLPWSATGILDEQIPTAVSDMFAVVSLIGPDAMIEAEGVRSGLFMQVANKYYPLHAHAAEETYVILAGDGVWTLDLAFPMRHGPGAYIHHPPNAAHATRTGAGPLLATWRWSGDLGRESYRLLEDPLA